MARVLADMIGTAGVVLSEEEKKRVYLSMRSMADEVERLRIQLAGAAGTLEAFMPPEEAMVLRAAVKRLRKYQPLLAAAKKRHDFPLDVSTNARCDLCRAIAVCEEELRL